MRSIDLQPRVKPTVPLTRHFVFFERGRLLPSPNIGQLARELVPLSAHHVCHSAMDRFNADETMFALPIIDESGVPVALIDRRPFIEFFSKPYSREIFARRELSALLKLGLEHQTPVVVDEHASVEEVAQVIVGAGMQHMVTGFLVTREERYLGVVDGHDLLNVITQRKQAELHYLAHYDSLTGIPNRMLLTDRVEQACREADRNGRLVGLLFIDVDQFKSINDKLGHRAGDDVLRKVVERIKASARSVDTVARLSGDEFVVLMEDLADSADVERLARRLIHAMLSPVDVTGHSLTVTVSIGSALYPRDDRNLNALLGKADAAMYEAKASGRNGYRAYAGNTASDENSQEWGLAEELITALSEGKLQLRFQPLIDLTTGQTKGAKALVCWPHPSKGLISDEDLLRLAENANCMNRLEIWRISEALAALGRWKNRCSPIVPISLEISSRQLHCSNFPALIEKLFAAYPAEVSDMEFEFSETDVMREPDKSLWALERIKASGVQIVIHDFGAAFSNVRYLNRFPIRRLKIAKSLVKSCDQPPNQSVIRAIVAMGSSLGFDVAADGIETDSEKAA